MHDLITTNWLLSDITHNNHFTWLLHDPLSNYSPLLPLLPFSYYCHLGQQSLNRLPWWAYHSSQPSIHYGCGGGSVCGIQSIHSFHTAPWEEYWWTWSSRGHPFVLWSIEWTLSNLVVEMQPTFRIHSHATLTQACRTRVESLKNFTYM